MKRILFLLPALLAISAVLAQDRLTDSLKRELRLSSTDTSRVHWLVQLSRNYYLQNPDSGLYFASIALSLAKRAGDTRGEMEALSQAGFSTWLLGDMPGALQMFVSSLHLADQLNDTWSKARNYDGMSCIYDEEGEPATGRMYAWKSEGIYFRIHDYENVVDILMDLNSFYLTAGMKDSALQAGLKGLRISERYGAMKWRPQLLALIGGTYSRMGNEQLAKDYCYQSLALEQRYGNPLSLIVSYYSLANVFLRFHERDSSIVYAKKSFEGSLRGNYYTFQATCASLLGKLYMGINDHEAARYYQWSQKIQDSVFSAQKAEQVLAINIAGQQREVELRNETLAFRNRMKLYAVGVALLLAVVILVIVARNNRRQLKANLLLEEQKRQIQQNLKELTLRQNQLIQSEKMASLGELVTGIAHEIQNPLNFVNNFSEISAELVEEMESDLESGRLDQARAIGSDLKKNLEKISHHGKRADFIVKGMLEHSRGNKGESRLTDLNQLAEDFFKLAYHGWRARDKNFTCELVTRLNPALPQVMVVQQDLGRVLLNLFNNAFYAVRQMEKTAAADYRPKVELETSLVGSTPGQQRTGVQIRIRDNGAGIPEDIRDKIMQPFFTTKPAGEGTGLGLSLSYDIIVKGHGGELKVNSQPGQYAEFLLVLPLRS